jgi:hypothetical protein
MNRLTPALVVCLLAAGARAQDAVGQRIAASAAAAQSLQGPLDGSWTLADTRGRTLFAFQIGDTPTRGAGLACAWRDPQGALGFAGCTRQGRRLTLRFGARKVDVERRTATLWRGMLRGPEGTRTVALRRP